MTITKAGRPILTIDEWGKYAGPKRAFQWKSHRSAKEAARCWLAVTSPALPPELASVLVAHPAFGPVAQWTAEPEVRLPFDHFPGEPRNTDLLVQARDQHGAYLIAVEAKADESFGSTVASTIDAANKRKVGTKRKAGNPRSNGVARVNGLIAAILGSPAVEDPIVGSLRYQLFTATAGVLRAGQVAGAQRVVLLVQEFKAISTSDKKHKANADDLNAFVHRLTRGNISVLNAGQLIGPFAVAGRPLFDPPVPDLFIGKIVCDVRSRPMTD